MQFSKEQIEKAASATSAEELLAMAKADGIELTENEAAEYFSFLHNSGSLSSEELSRVAGGKGTEPVYAKWCKYCNCTRDQRYMGVGPGWDETGIERNCDLYLCTACGKTNYYIVGRNYVI